MLDGGLGKNVVEEGMSGEGDTNPISRREYREGLASMGESMNTNFVVTMKEMKELRELVLGLIPQSPKTTTTVLPEDLSSSKRNNTSQTNSGGSSPPKPMHQASGSGIHSAMPPPTTYHHHVSMAIIRHLGDLPILDKLNYPTWVFQM